MRLCEQRLCLAGSPLRDQPLRVLQLRDREPHHWPDLVEDLEGPLETALGILRCYRQLGTEPCCMSDEERRSLARPPLLDDPEQLLDLRGITQLVGRLERLHEHQLGRQEGDAEVCEASRQVALDCRQAPTRVAFHANEHGFVQDEAQAILKVGLCHVGVGVAL